MDINKIIKKLHSIMYLDFDERSKIFQKYRDILKFEISINPSNIEAYCLLAMINNELRENTETIEILEQCYTQNELNFSEDGFALLATDMAYFLLEECGESYKERAINLLLQAINLNSKYASTYYAYGKVCFEKNDYKKASKLFIKHMNFHKKSNINIVRQFVYWHILIKKKEYNF